MLFGYCFSSTENEDEGSVARKLKLKLNDGREEWGSNAENSNAENRIIEFTVP